MNPACHGPFLFIDHRSPKAHRCYKCIKSWALPKQVHYIVTLFVRNWKVSQKWNSDEQRLQMDGRLSFEALETETWSLSLDNLEAVWTLRQSLWTLSLGTSAKLGKSVLLTRCSLFDALFGAVSWHGRMASIVFVVEHGTSWYDLSVFGH